MVYEYFPNIYYESFQAYRRQNFSHRDCYELNPVTTLDFPSVLRTDCPFAFLPTVYRIPIAPHPRQQMLFSVF